MDVGEQQDAHDREKGTRSGRTASQETPPYHARIRIGTLERVNGCWSLPAERGPKGGFRGAEANSILSKSTGNANFERLRNCNQG
jgi:hypothetical protein